jgi:eukaryotic-like serine/threonine-protein kinase
MEDSVEENQPAAAPTASSWTCPTCNNTYPSDFAVCPRDATPRAEQHASTTDPLIGEVLGRSFRIVRVIGEGGMARLYEAEHLRIDARYAVKVIHDDLSRDPDLLARFEREARAAARIHSEHVVRLIDVLRTQDNRPCLITELLEGEDLQAMLDRVKRLSVAEAIPIARQICRAIAAAHAVGVIHRDLKPSNVFLCKTPTRTDRFRPATKSGSESPASEGASAGSVGGPLVKVFDFGVAKLEDEEKLLTRTDTIMGTAAYMAPEQAKRAADAGPLADVYSTSAVLYHMLTGQPPYGNVPAFSRLAMVLHEEPARPRSIEPTIPEGIEAVIQHAMARDRTTRVQSALELEAQLAAFDRSPATPRTTSTALGALGALGAGTASGAGGDPVATEIVVRARVARPLAGFVAAASSLGAGAWIAALLAGFILSPSGGERALIGIIAIAAIAGVGFLHVRTLRPIWRSAPAVFRHIRPAARALVAGGLTFGALELVAVGAVAVFGTPPLGASARVILAGLAASLGLCWQRFRLDERLRRWIG